MSAPFLVTALMGAAANAQDTAVAPPSTAASAVTDSASPIVVVVTASKRKERLIDTPVAITAINSDKLDNLGVQSFQDYAGLVPNLNTAGGSTPGAGAVVMRGMYTGPTQATSTTAFYIGETPFTSSGAFALGSFIVPDVDLFDVARIEVLKGPQGTLYGSTALGGLIRIVPKLPDTQSLGGSVRLGLSGVHGGGDGGSAKVSLNVPVVTGLMAVQVNGFDRREGGFVTNTETGHSDLGRSTSKGGGLTALLTPGKDLDVTLRSFSQKLDANGPVAQQNLLGTGTPVTGERQFAFLVDPASSTKYDLTELSLEYRASMGTLTATASQGRSRLRNEADYTAYTQAVQASLHMDPTGRGLAPSDVQQKRKVAEVRFATKRMGSVEGLLGVFTTDEDSDYSAEILGRPSANSPLPAPLDDILGTRTTGSYKETAVFGNLTYYIDDATDLSAGLRRAANRQHYLIQRSGLLGSPAPAAVASEDNSTTYQVTARYRPTKELSTFARVATGYRPGGPQNNLAAPNPTFAPDTVTDYELGVKGLTMAGHLSFDASVYRIDWKKIQLNGLLDGIVVVGNAGKATVNGFEAQSTYSDPSGFSLGASLGFNDAKLRDVAGTTAVYIGAAAGDPLPGSPKVTAALYGDYDLMAIGKSQASVGATLRYQGSKHASFSGPSVNPDYVMPAYTTLDLRATLRRDPYSVRLAVDNVTDRNGFTGYSTTRVSPAQNVPSYAYLVRPRTVSVTVGADF